MRSYHEPIQAVYLIDSLESGGAQRQLVELVKGVDKKIIRPHVVIYHNIMHFRNDLEQAGIPVFFIQKQDKLGILFLIRFVSFVYRRKITMIHSFLNIPNFYARMTKMFVPSLFVVTSERNISILHSKIHTCLEKLFWRISNKIIVNTDKIKDVLVENVTVDTARICVVNNGVDLEFFASQNELSIRTIRQQLLPEKDALLIGLVGRICVQKGQNYAVEAAKILCSINPDLNYKMCFWGSEDDAEYVKKVKLDISRYGLDEKVVLAGVQRDIPSIMKAIDLLILPSLWEGFPNVLLETIASRTPVIATDIVDNHQIITNGKTGFLVEPANSQALAEKIAVFSDMGLEEVEKMTIMAHDSISSRFSVEAMVRNTMQVYEEAGFLKKGNG